jgi:hypothetical protein
MIDKSIYLLTNMIVKFCTIVLLITLVGDDSDCFDVRIVVAHFILFFA